jgi:8-oxo-dGTP diphosphatase
MSDTVADRSNVAPSPTSQFVIREGAKAFINCAGRVLLQKERHSDGDPFWTLPGGGVESQETTQAALSRELYEELQTESVIGEQIGWFPYAHLGRASTVSLYRVLDCVTVETPDPNSSEGVYDCRWVEPHDPPTRTLPQVEWLLQRECTRPEKS